MRPKKDMFRHWSHYRTETIDRSEFVQRMQPIRKMIDGLLLRGVFSGDAKLSGMCKPLYEHRE